MSTLAPTSSVPAKSDRPSRSLLGALKHGLDRFDTVVAEHPKTAVAVAALAGGAAGAVTASRPRGNALTEFVSKTVATVGTTVVAGLGIEALLAEFPDVLQQLATTLHATPGHVEAAVVGTVLAAGALLGRALASRGKKSEPCKDSSEARRPLPERLPSMIARTVLPYSGTILGSAIGVGIAALLGPLTLVPVAVGVAGGAFAGTALGPVAHEKGLSNRWWKAFIYSLIPMGALIGYHVGGTEHLVQGALYGAFGTAAGTKGMAHDILFR